jgi:hypothetical protein
MVFDDAADGIRYLTNYLLANANKIDPLLTEHTCAVTISQSSEECRIQRIHMHLIPTVDRANLLYRRLSFDKFENIMQALSSAGCIMEQITELTASTYRNRYLNLVAKKQPGIHLEVHKSDWPEDPNHPIHKEYDANHDAGFFGEDDFNGDDE